jgi:biotin synthase-like enzyme
MVLSQPVEVWEMVRMIATARIVMPRAMVRLSAGRVRFSQPEQVNHLTYMSVIRKLPLAFV